MKLSRFKFIQTLMGGAAAGPEILAGPITPELSQDTPAPAMVSPVAANSVAPSPVIRRFGSQLLSEFRKKDATTGRLIECLNSHERIFNKTDYDSQTLAINMPDFLDFASRGEMGEQLDPEAVVLNYVEYAIQRNLHPAYESYAAWKTLFAEGSAHAQVIKGVLDADKAWTRQCAKDMAELLLKREIIDQDTDLILEARNVLDGTLEEDQFHFFIRRGYYSFESQSVTDENTPQREILERYEDASAVKAFMNSKGIDSKQLDWLRRHLSGPMEPGMTQAYGLKNAFSTLLHHLKSIDPRLVPKFGEEDKWGIARFERMVGTAHGNLQSDPALKAWELIAKLHKGEIAPAEETALREYIDGERPALSAGQKTLKPGSGPSGDATWRERVKTLEQRLAALEGAMQRNDMN